MGCIANRTQQVLTQTHTDDRCSLLVVLVQMQQCVRMQFGAQQRFGRVQRQQILSRKCANDFVRLLRHLRIAMLDVRAQRLDLAGARPFEIVASTVGQSQLQPRDWIVGRTQKVRVIGGNGGRRCVGLGVVACMRFVVCVRVAVEFEIALVLAAI